MSERIALLLGATGNYAFAAANLLLGIREFCPDAFAAIRILHQDLDPRDAERLRAILPCRCEPYQQRFEARSEKMRQSLAAFSNLTFARYEVFPMLAEYDKVLWLDLDIVVLGDLRPLLDYARTGLGLAPVVVGEKAGIAWQFHGRIEGYEMRTTSYNAGVMLVSRLLPRREEFGPWLYEATARYIEQLRFADQGILHLAIQEFGIEVDPLPKSLFNAYPPQQTAESILVHMTGPSPKVWRDYAQFMAYPDWGRRHCEWVNMGGRECDALIETDPRFAIGDPSAPPRRTAEYYAQILLRQDHRKLAARCDALERLIYERTGRRSILKRLLGR